MTETLEKNRLAGAELTSGGSAQAPQGPPAKGGISVAADVMNRSTASLPEDQRLALRWLYGFAMEQHWQLDTCAEKVGIGSSTLYKIWTGRYQDAEKRTIDAGGIAEKILAFKKLALQREGLERLPFIETSVSRRMFKVFDKARITQTIGFIFGDGQVGKTISGMEYARLNNSGQTVYFRMPACAGSSRLLKLLGHACHIHAKLPFEELWQKVLECFDHSKLLIVDEAHLLFETYQERSALRCIEMLRELHDRTGCGIVFISTNVFKNEMETGQYKNMLKQLRRRGIYELQLPVMPPAADIAAMAKGYGLGEPTATAEETVKVVINKHGLGQHCKLLMEARHRANKRKERMTWQHYTDAHAGTVRISLWET